MYTRNKRPYGSIRPGRSENEGLRIDLTYFNTRIRYPTGLPDTQENNEILRKLLDTIYSQIQEGVFRFVDVFPHAPTKDKVKFTLLEGREFEPLPKDLKIGEYARIWLKEWSDQFNELDKINDYASAVRRIQQFFEDHTFGELNTKEVENFITRFHVIRGANKGKKASSKRIKNVMYVFKRIWLAACGQYGWTLADPFVTAGKYVSEIKKVEKIRKAASATLDELISEDECDPRQVFLLSEWKKFLSCIDPYYRPVTEFLVLTMMIGSEVEALPKKCITESNIKACLKRDKSGRILNLLKTDVRKRTIPLTKKLREVINAAMSQSDSDFVFTMKDGSDFDYSAYIKYVWTKGLIDAGLPHHVGYSARHTGIGWHMLLRVEPERLIGLTGHADKNMIYNVYGKYRDGLSEEREEILEYMGADLLLESELNAFRDAGTRSTERGLVEKSNKSTLFAAEILSDKFSDKSGLYPDNYPMTSRG